VGDGGEDERQTGDPGAPPRDPNSRRAAHITGLLLSSPHRAPLLSRARL